MIGIKSGIPVKKMKSIGWGDTYYVCPSCGKKVAGYYTTGGGDNDWGYRKDKFCCNCGLKMDWGKEEK